MNCNDSNTHVLVSTGKTGIRIISIPIPDK